MQKILDFGLLGGGGSDIQYSISSVQQSVQHMAAAQVSFELNQTEPVWDYSEKLDQGASVVRD